MTLKLEGKTNQNKTIPWLSVSFYVLGVLPFTFLNARGHWVKCSYSVFEITDGFSLSFRCLT